MKMKDEAASGPVARHLDVFVKDLTLQLPHL